MVCENTILNKLIVSLADSFVNLDESQITFYDYYEDVYFDKIDKEEEEIIVISSTLMYDDDFRKISENLTSHFIFIAKDAEETLNEEYVVTNWYIYWTNAINNLNKNYEFDEEIINMIFQYYQKYPSPSQRRIIEYLSVHLGSTRKTFVEILANETLQMIQNRGKQVIENKQKIINKDKNNALIKSINNIRYALCVSNYFETAYQINDTLNVDGVILFEISLRKNFVTTSIIMKEKDNSLFSNRKISKSGHIYSLRIDFSEFVDLITKY